jgi:hypothetical protein
VLNLAEATMCILEEQSNPAICYSARRATSNAF